jgi:spore coat polysaccharide biosynthesis predicted glycosyltransferase SpsG
LIAHVALVADAGADAGLGHLSRCSAIAAVLRRNGHTVRCRAYGAHSPVERYGVGWEPLPSPGPIAVDERVLVLDSYHVGAHEQAALGRDHQLVLLHDAGTIPAGALAIVTRGRQACLGPDYWDAPPRRVRDEVKAVLVTTGGGAAGASLGARLAGAVRSALSSVNVALVTGPFARTSPLDGVRVVAGASSLAGELAAADLVVSGAGQTMLEAAALGTPCVALVIAENQRRQADEMAAAGAADVVGDEDAAVARVVALAADRPVRQALAQHGQAAIDGGGARRVAARIEALL